MRIAYIAPYQGPALKARRPISLNLSLAGTVRIETIARLLRESAHAVEIFSQGEVVELALKFYPGFTEPVRFHPDIPVTYSSALPVRYLNGIWQGSRLLSLFKARHRAAPFDLVIIYNLKVPQVMCAEYAMQRLGLPVVFEYEDDNFLGIDGQPSSGLRPGYVRRAREVMSLVAGGMACSPHLLAQLPAGVPRLLVRGVVGEEIMRAGGKTEAAKNNWVLFSGTLSRTKGVAPLIKAWPQAQLAGWELHIAGDCEDMASLKQLAGGRSDIIFHGLVRAPGLAELTALSRICINPHDLSRQPGNVFATKIVEYLAAGAHVISTPMGAVEKEIAAGMTFMPDNTPETIARTLQQVVRDGDWRKTAQQAVLDIYRPEALRAGLDNLMRACVRGKAA